ncbi:acylneuraminate cytidylyltransferase family protein [Acuticoccus mangrovi]|uniref:acylneuraminate cytidylyltransferase family protein n=1 Tax=Acuticoccus mangrovi TaxID=2796142 RepID=UPI0022B74B83|nr:NTP transferase domain-containing protein [Acuticoccus mangrovi]
MIPARMGSQRLPKKNLRELAGVPLIVHAIRKCKTAGCFDEIVVNSEDAGFAPYAEAEGVRFYQRPEKLGDNNATSEDFVGDFFLNEPCDRLVQVHSIAPLLTAEEVRDFVKAWDAAGTDVMLSAILDQIEVAYKGEPVNFTFAEKTNSQELTPVQRITWSITGWTRETFLAARAAGRAATYAGTIGYFPVSSVSGYVVKTAEDLQVVEALYGILRQGEAA